MEDSDRCDELQDFIDTLFDLRERLNSKDLKDEIDYLIGEYNTELDELNDKLSEEAKSDLDYLNKEYIKNAI